MSAGPYIESGRTLATLLFVVLYLGFTQSNSYATRLEQLMEARQAVGAELAIRYVGTCPPFQEWRRKQPSSKDDSDLVVDWLKKNLKYPCTLPAVPWASELEVSPIGTMRRGFFWISYPSDIVFQLRLTEYTQARKWIANINVNIKDSVFDPSQLSLPAEFPMTSVARHNGFKIEKDEDTLTLFSRFENDLLSKEVVLPGSGFSFPVGRIVWICFLIAFAMLVLLRDRVHKIFEDPHLGKGEPGLILDAESGIAARLAEVWMIGMFAGPWLLAVATLRMTALYFHAQGPVHSGLFEVAMFAALCAVAMAAGRISLCIISDLLRLRRLQREAERSWLNDPEISEP